MTLHEFNHSHEPGCYMSWTIMEKWRRSKLARWADKLAVENDPDLTTAQLML